MATRKVNSFVRYVVILILLLVVALGCFVFFSPMFEKNPPKISLIKDKIYWNLKDPLKISITDESKIKKLEIVYNDEENKNILFKQDIVKREGNTAFLKLKPKKLIKIKKVKEGNIQIRVLDSSMWNFFAGNETTKNIKVVVDRMKPYVNIIKNSYAIKRGGSAIVVAKINDANLKDAHLLFNGNTKFNLIPYKKEKYYVCVFAWPVHVEKFERVEIEAVDKAGNVSRQKVPLYIRKAKKFKKDSLEITDNYLNNVASIVLENSGIEIPSDPVEIFLEENSRLRTKNVATIKRVSLENLSTHEDKFNLKIFRRLKSSATVAGYGEERTYFYEGKKIDKQWHLGMDWASFKKAKIYASNPGKVIYKNYLGIYGNSIIIDHGFGIGTLYAHTSSSKIEVGDDIARGEYFANTGATGAVFGDHLHFGVLIQGLEVNPDEWLSAKWLKDNIVDILKKADKEIK